MRWPAGVTQVGESWEHFHVREGDKFYRARVFKLKFDKRPGQTFHAAFEVRDFPSGQNPTLIPLGTGNAKRLVGDHAYALKYRGKKVLLFTDRAN